MKSFELTDEFVTIVARIRTMLCYGMELDAIHKEMSFLSEEDFFLAYQAALVMENSNG